MGPETSPSRQQADLYLLAKELRELRDLLGTLSMHLSDIQFESDPDLKAWATAHTDRLLKSCQTRVT